ncbi:MAG: tRNA (adenosine(37)-N6)-dimethylallyltransferase MiaA [Lautropia sp.]
MLLGPTASGKSALAMALAERFPIEIVSVDSAQVYVGMDVGTAKPDAAERARVAHHLIDIRDPAEPYNAAAFATDARARIAEISARRRLPLLVGGTMLYARALRTPFDALPPADPAIRARIDAEAAALGWPALHRQLAALDAATAARLEPADAQRIQRALEVIELTGQPLSRLHAATARSAPSPLPVLSLEPSDRAVLHARIAQRFDRMLAEGFVAEVERLRARADLDRDLPSMRAVGYRQALDCLDGRRPMATLRDAGIAATRQLAKRQLTWLRGMDVAHRLDCNDPRTVQRAAALVDAHLRQPPSGASA